MHKTTIQTHSRKRGFTLIEVMVSVTIFSMVMLASTSAVFSIVQANKKSHTIKSVMTNLNFALESIARDIRVGSKYRCASSESDSGITPQDCSSSAGDVVLSYRANRDVSFPSNGYDEYDRIMYWRDTTSGTGRIMKRVEGQTPLAITSPEIDITELRFYVTGAPESDGKQPLVLITIKGFSGTGPTRSDFTIQTTLTQRAIDS